MPPKSKKRRVNGEPITEDTVPPAPITPDRNTWPGWCEVESEPAFFNAILHDIGVSGLKVVDSLGLDDFSLLELLPKPVHAMIYLFRYRNEEKEDRSTTCPPNVWFANQVPDFACASVALLNIVMNIPDAHLGPQLEQFKLSTQSLHPVSRGDAIASCEFVRSAHNSFARDNDMLHIDNLLKTKYANLIKRQKLDAVNAARVAKTAEKRSQRPFAPKRNDGRASRSNPARKARASNLSENDDLFDSEAFHFVAYMPVDGQVWKLDGMDYSPQLVENVSEGQQWLKIAQSELLTQMMQYLEGQIEFSLMAVIDDPNTVGTKSLAENVKAMQELDGKLDTLSSNWRENFVPILPDDNEDTVHDLSGKYCVTEDDVKRAVLPASFMEELEEKSLEELVQLRRELFMTQGSLTVGIRSQDRQDQGDAAKTLHRRYDYGSFVDGWFSALAEEDALRPLLEKDE